MRRAYPTATDIRRIKELHQQGHSQTKIGEALGWSQTTISELLRPGPRSRKAAKRTSSMKQEIPSQQETRIMRYLHGRGLTRPEIAKATGWSPATVSAVLRNDGSRQKTTKRRS